MSARLFTDEEAIKAIQDKNNLTIRMVLKVIRGNAYSGTNYQIIWDIVSKYNLDVSHWKGAGFRENVELKPISYWLTDNCPTKISSWKLRNRLFKSGLKQKKCEGCGISEWMGKPAPLELDHVNGHRIDNRLSNLKILCPNCHAQTPTYKSKNRKAVWTKTKQKKCIT